MKKYKAKCEIDKYEGNGIEYYDVFIRKIKDEAEAHEFAKHYMLTEFPQWALYNIVLTEIM